MNQAQIPVIHATGGYMVLVPLMKPNHYEEVEPIESPSCSKFVDHICIIICSYNELLY